MLVSHYGTHFFPVLRKAQCKMSVPKCGWNTCLQMSLCREKGLPTTGVYRDAFVNPNPKCLILKLVIYGRVEPYIKLPAYKRAHDVTILCMRFAGWISRMEGDIHFKKSYPTSHLMFAEFMIKRNERMSIVFSASSCPWGWPTCTQCWRKGVDNLRCEMEVVGVGGDRWDVFTVKTCHRGRSCRDTCGLSSHSGQPVHFFKFANQVLFCFSGPFFFSHGLL